MLRTSFNSQNQINFTSWGSKATEKAKQIEAKSAELVKSLADPNSPHPFSHEDKIIDHLTQCTQKQVTGFFDNLESTLVTRFDIPLDRRASIGAVIGNAGVILRARQKETLACDCLCSALRILNNHVIMNFQVYKVIRGY